MRGADAATLEAKIKQHYIVPATTDSDGSSLTVNGYPDITSNVDVKNVKFSPFSNNCSGGMSEPARLPSCTQHYQLRLWVFRI